MKRIFELSLYFHKNKGFTLYGALFLASGIIFSISRERPRENPIPPYHNLQAVW